jgi:hypothetical protein
MRALQGKTLNNDRLCCGAAHAVDRDLLTSAVILTNNGGGWLKLELERNFFIHKVIIYCRFYTGWYQSHPCTKTIAKFKACVDNDNNVDVSVYKGDAKQKSCGTLKLTYGLNQSDQIYTLICNTEGDTVKLSKDAGIIAVFEVAVVSTGIFWRNKHLTKAICIDGTA